MAPQQLTDDLAERHRLIEKLRVAPLANLGLLYRLIMYTSLITGLQAIARTLTAQLILGLQPDLVVIAMIFTLSTFIYGRDRLAGAATDAKTDARTRWIIKHQRGLSFMVRGFGSCGFLLMLLRPRTIPFLAMMLCLALLYTVPWLPGRRSLKQLPGMKTIFVAAIWSAVSVGLPVTVAGSGWTIRERLVSIVLFLFMCVIVTINDLFDIEPDRQHGIQSLPVLWGEAWVHRICVTVSCIGALIAFGCLGCPGLALAGLYHAAYAMFVRVSLGRDYFLNTLMYRASSFIMLFLVAILE